MLLVELEDGVLTFRRKPKLLSPDEARRIGRRILHDRRTGCMIWTGPTTRKGHPICYVGGRKYMTRRLLMTVRGPVRPGRYLRATCGRPLCVNPNHAEFARELAAMRELTRPNRRRFSRLGN